MTVTLLVEQTLTSCGSGCSADMVAKSVLAHLIKDDEPFQSVELSDYKYLLQMMKEADKFFIYGESSTFYFIAYYSHSNDYPVGRSYFKKERNIAEIGKWSEYFKQNGISLPMYSPRTIGTTLSDSGYQGRVKEYKQKKKIELAPFIGLFDGRKEKNIVDQAVFMNSPGCLICGSRDYLMMSSVVNAGNGQMLGFNLCQAHIDESLKCGSLIEFLAKDINHKLSFHTEPLNTKSHLAIVLSWIPEALSATVEKVFENTITLRRKTSFKIVLRLDAPLDYAYMIFEPTGKKEVARFDSADHHPIPFGPSHLHAQLPKCKTAESSFTTGTPMIDIKAILKILEEKEAEYMAKEKAAP